MSNTLTVDPELETIEVDEFGEIVHEGDNQSQAIAVRPVDYLALVSAPNSVDIMLARRAQVQDMVDRLLVKGTHYGQIPGTQGESLWLAGAEEIAGQFGFRVILTFAEKDVDRSETPPYIEYRYTATVWKGSDIVVTCDGSCNIREDCFRVWIPATAPDKDTQAKMIALKTGKWDSWNGAEVWKEKVDHPNPYTQINNIQKRAQKRAYVGAIEKATGISGFFAKMVSGAKKHFGDNSGRHSAANAKQQSGEIGPNEFWSKVRSIKIAQPEAKAIADLAISNEITWAEALNRLPKAA